MAVLKRRTRPAPWPRQRAQAKYGWLIPLFALEWSWRWLAYLLSGWAFLEVLEYFGTLFLLVAAVSYFGESKDRMKQKHYQAWHFSALFFTCFGYGFVVLAKIWSVVLLPDPISVWEYLDGAAGDGTLLEASEFPNWWFTRPP